jgi:hypothetical protein
MVETWAVLKENSMLRRFIAFLCLMWGSTGLNGPDGQPTNQEIADRAAAIRPTAEEMRWQQIPWLGSLVEASEQAKRENRPILVWTLDEDPFERC